MLKWGGILFVILLTLALATNAAATPVFFTDESLFNSAIGGAALDLESFESDFTDGTTSVAFTDVTVTGDENLILTNPSSLATDGTGTIGIVDFSFNGNFVTFAFNSPVNAVSLSILAPLDVSSSGTLALSNDNGASQMLFSAPLPDFSTQFAGLVDDMMTFNSITISSTQTGDGIQFDRLRFGLIDFDSPPIPEPSTLFLLGSGLVAVGALHRRRTCSSRLAGRSSS